MAVARIDPARYERWYHTRRGRWIARREFAVMRALLRPERGQSLLDVGCGTGHFSRLFCGAGPDVTGIDADPFMLACAQAQGDDVTYVQATAMALPIKSRSVDWAVAITSLCFVDDPGRALEELWRVARQGVLLGLLNRDSLLHRDKAGRGGYAGARWDRLSDVHAWSERLDPPVGRQRVRTAVVLPSGDRHARLVERVLPSTFPWGGFLAVCLDKHAA